MLTFSIVKPDFLGMYMRILGIDYGSKRVGMAVSDPLGITAQGVQAIFRKNIVSDMKEIHDLIDKNDIVEVVIGLPENMNNTLGEKAKEVFEFIESLKTYISIPVKTFDERLSAVIGTRVMKEAKLSGKKMKKKIDMVAAQIILQGYLDMVKSVGQNDEVVI